MLDAADFERGVGVVGYEWEEPAQSSAISYRPGALGRQMREWTPCPVRVLAQDSWLLVLKQWHELELGDVHQTFVAEF